MTRRLRKAVLLTDGRAPTASRGLCRLDVCEPASTAWPSVWLGCFDGKVPDKWLEVEELGFANRESLTSGSYDSDEGRREIDDEIARFIDRTGLTQVGGTLRRVVW